MLGRVTQPPVNPLLRDPEHHDFWPGFVLVIIASAILLIGARHSTNLETTDGDSASELQLIKSLSCGGLQAKSAVTVPNHSSFSDPEAAAAALERMAREEAKPLRIKYRVNTGAVDPCPT